MTNKKKHKAEIVRGPLFMVLETATGASSVAVYEGSQLLGLQEYHANRTHARLITVMVEQLLSNLELVPAALAAIVVTRGPGSYTGLRVGVSAAKGLAMALDIPLLSVGSLQALACSVQDIALAMGARICSMIDARRMEVYCQVFDRDAVAETLVEAKIIDESAFADILSENKLIFIGDGAEKCRDILENKSNAIVLGSRLSSAARLGELVLKKFQQKDFEDLITFEPYYLKNFVATLPKKKIL